MTLTSAERTRAFRARCKELGVFDSSRRYRKEHKREYKRTRPSRAFVGVDGEGCGVDDRGRQLYMLFRVGSRELFTGDRLTTEELLDFICESDPDVILVGFAFGYDCTMILRDLPVRQQERLFEPKIFEPGHSRDTWYKDFNIDYLPRQYLRVKRVIVKHWMDAETGERKEARIPIEGSQRTIYETFGFFQKSFVNSLKALSVGTAEQVASIDANKKLRSSFDSITREVRDYCALECELLAELMETLRGHCTAAGIIPRTWNGAGKLAAALHTLHETPKRKIVCEAVPKEVHDFANMAYYGGRFEITRVGAIHDKVYEYDICSAYPAAMRRLPCLFHGTWEPNDAGGLRRAEKIGELFVASCTFNQGAHAKSSFARLGGLPIRSREGHLYWPARGGGIYWSPEIESARKLGFRIGLKDGWVYHCECDCTPFDWVATLYEYRKSIGSQGAGYPIKLGINSLYGKLAQRKGNGVFHNMIWAGLITALTRAQINDAIALAPDNIVMIATDAVYSLKPLTLDIGDNLGQWETKDLDGLFIVQPGLYWCPEKRKRKSRGLSGSFFEQPGFTEAFESAWRGYEAEYRSGIQQGFPTVDIPVPGFIGLRLALSRGRPELAGTWLQADNPDAIRTISFDYTNKRQLHEWRDGHIVTGIKPGSPGLLSLPHRDFLAAGGAEPWENARAVLEEQPDYIELTPPFED